MLLDPRRAFLAKSSNFFNLKVSRSFENSCAPKVNRQFSSELQRKIFAKCDKISWRLNKILKTLNDLLKLETQQKLVINSAKERLKHGD